MDDHLGANARAGTSRHLRAERIVEGLRADDSAFADLVADRDVDYHAIDDYGMGAIWLAELRSGVFRWTGPPDYR